ncbi:hypothetical protein FQN57_007233 [Myotisia sp. PD_48]|nr:hypothetical protein FQN57_007233 [Myotisia sp. PD_48]
MFAALALPLLSLLAAAQASSNQSQPIQWQPCDETEVNSTVPIQCGNFHVPLDYTDKTSDATLKLELAKVPATSQPSKGSILFNFGGPGGEGRPGLASLAPILLALTGGKHDLIAFDPRGTGNTLPFSCIDTELDKFVFLSELKLANSSDTALGRLWAVGETHANLCLKNGNETGRLISTAFVARDFISVVDAIEEDRMLRYWGMSYGTTLGATIAAMFPDKIDKMILDGVQNPHEYYNALSDFEEWTDSDKVFSAIFSHCIEAGPDRCALAGRNATAAELEQSIWDLLYKIKEQPIPVGNAVLDYSTLKMMLAEALYTPDHWPSLTKNLAALLDGDVPEAWRNVFSLIGEPEILISLYGIHCGEKRVRAASLDEFLPAVDKLSRISRIFGDLLSIAIACSHWKIEAKERYTGDFQVKTKNPVLFIGNTFDGHTPLVSAYNVSSGFEGSVVLEVNGYGHGSVALPSKCTLETVSKYWEDGTLPDPETVCKVDAPPFSGLSWPDILNSTSGNETANVKRNTYVPGRGHINNSWLV